MTKYIFLILTLFSSQFVLSFEEPYRDMTHSKEFTELKKRPTIKGKSENEIAKVCRVLYRGKTDGSLDQQIFQHCLASADMGNAESMAYLGALYESGTGVDSNPKLAISYYTESATKKNPAGLLFLGLSFCRGFQVKQNYDTCEEFLQSASDSDFTPAITRLALLKLAEYGYGPEAKNMDVPLAISLLEKAAKQGDSEAMYQLALLHAQDNFEFFTSLYAFKDKDKLVDTRKSIDWFKKCASLGHVDCMFTLSGLYAEGKGGLSDSTKIKGLKPSVYWMKRAEDAGIKD